MVDGPLGGEAPGGRDGLVFTAGVGENAPAIRARVAERLGRLGAELDVALAVLGGRGLGEPVASG